MPVSTTNRYYVNVPSGDPMSGAIEIAVLAGLQTVSVGQPAYVGGNIISIWGDSSTDNFRFFKTNVGSGISTLVNTITGGGIGGAAGIRTVRDEITGVIMTICHQYSIGYVISTSSNDGTSWTNTFLGETLAFGAILPSSLTSDGTGQWQMLCLHNSGYIAFITSDDLGVTWVLGENLSALTPASPVTGFMCFSPDNRFVAVLNDADSYIVRSEDGTGWTLEATFTSAQTVGSGFRAIERLYETE